MDLFKFYVDELKARYHEDKKNIKEILKENKFDVEITTTLEEFSELLSKDKRTALADPANIKLTYNGLYEKAELKEKERQREEMKKVKKFEQNFRSLLKKLDIVDASATYETVKEKLIGEEAFENIESEQDRERLFNEHISSLQETCLHHIKKKKEKKRKSNRKSRSPSPSNVANQSEMQSDDEDGNREGAGHNNKQTGSKMDEEEEPTKSSKKHKKSKKRKRAKSVSILLKNMLILNFISRSRFFKNNKQNILFIN